MGPLFSVGLFIIAFSLYDSLDLGKHVNPGGTEGFSGAGKADPSASTSQDASSRSERPLEVSQEELWREVDRMRSERNVVGDSGWTSEWVTSRENRLGDLINELRVRERMHRLAPYRLQAVVDYLESKYSVEALDEIIRDVKEKGVGSSFYNESKIDRDLPKEGALKASVGDSCRNLGSSCYTHEEGKMSSLRFSSYRFTGSSTLFSIICVIRQYLGHLTMEHHVGFEAAAWYWHFVDVVWLFPFIFIYWWGGQFLYDIDEGLKFTIIILAKLKKYGLDAPPARAGLSDGYDRTIEYVVDYRIGSSVFA
ncbi:cytochrome c oxidase subunit 3 [Tanacetum coccineum]